MAEPSVVLFSRWLAVFVILLLTSCIVIIFYALFALRMRWRARWVLLITFAVALFSISTQFPAASLLFTGEEFSPTIRGDSTLAGFVADTPQKFLVGVHLITYEPTFPFLTALPSAPIGTYQYASRSIWIDKESADPGVWIHEVGHHVWYYHLTDDERTTFSSFHNESQPTNYSSKNIQEDFAESFAIYFGVKDGMLNSERWHFINTVTTRILSEPYLMTTRGITGYR